MHILIQSLTKTFKLKVERTDTIQDIKVKIEETEKIPQNQQKLHFNEELDDRKTLSEYNIQDDSKLLLILKVKCGFQIFVKMNTVPITTITLDVDLDDSIRFVKEKIYMKLSIVPKDQNLIFAGTSLEDQKTIRDYNIKKEHALQLIKTNYKENVQLPQMNPCLKFFGFFFKDCKK